MDVEGNFFLLLLVFEGVVLVIVLGFGVGDGSLLVGFSGGNNGSGNGVGCNGGKNGGGLNGGSGSVVLVVFVLLFVVFIFLKVMRLVFGWVGCLIDLCVNYFKVRLMKFEDVFYYNVSFICFF